MTVFRPTYHSPIFEPATYSTKKGIKLARFRLPKSGMYVTGEVMPSGKAKVQSPLYFARIRKNGKSTRVALGVTDKGAAEQLAAKLQLAADQQRAGIVDHMAAHRATPLTEHVKDFRDHMEAGGCDPVYIKEVMSVIDRVCKACRFRETDDLAPAPLNTHLASLIRKGLSHRTRNRHLTSIRALVLWMLKTDRLEGSDPFKTCRKLNQDLDKRHERRALTTEEVNALVAAAQQGDLLQKITGPERALIYAVCVTTGLRAKEAALLLCGDVVTDAEIPFIALPAAVAKSHRSAIMPIHPSLITRLEEWIADRPHDSHLFHLLTSSGQLRRTDLLMKHDCKQAGVVYYGQLGVADFHALRTTYCTNVCRRTDQFQAMKMVRHTRAAITAAHYDKVLLANTAKVTSMLPAPAKS